MNWYGPPTWRTWLLAPLSFLYWCLTRFWHALFDLGLRTPERIPGVTVMSVGNIVVGGAGKTPLIIHLANEAVAAGHRVAVLSRGYGRRRSEPCTFTAASLPTVDEAGDEPRLIARSCPAVTLFVDADRVAAARRAASAGFQLLLLDDGFQHRRLARDVDLVVDVGAGNGFVLPAGPLREPVAALRRATHVWKREVDVVTSVKTMRAPDGTTHPLSGAKVVLLLGVARPERVVESVTAAGASVLGLHGYRDHHAFTADEVARAQADAAAHSAILATTAKDAERLPAGTAYVLQQTLTAPPLASLLSPRR